MYRILDALYLDAWMVRRLGSIFASIVGIYLYIIAWVEVLYGNKGWALADAFLAFFLIILASHLWVKGGDDE